MRLHRLEIEAFGPFRDRQYVDFDDLTSAGLFLLHGSTGAGKTSVLDAVCFALYGKVPGARGSSTSLRSHYAEAGELPEVVLEFSVGPRRFEIRRSPSWERAKKRGEGTITAHARVVVQELIDGAWVARTTRIDEAAHLLEGVIGLGADQFTKLVMLPQGEFAAFLRADADSRRVLLEKIFGTDRFTGVQEWAREHRARLRTELDQVERTTDVLLAAADQAATVVLRTAPASTAGTLAAELWQRSGLTRLAAPAATSGSGPSVDSFGDPLAQVAALLAAVGQVREQALTDQQVAEQSAFRAEVVFNQAQAMAELAGRFGALVSRQEAAEACRGEIAAVTVRIDQARRAQALGELIPTIIDARAEHQSALHAERRAQLRLAEVPTDPNLRPTASLASPETVTERQERWRQERDELAGALSILGALEPQLAEQLKVSVQEVDLQREALAHTEAVAAAQSALAAGLQWLADAERTHAVAVQQSSGLAHGQAALTELRRVQRVVLERDRLAGEVADALPRLQSAREAALTAREHYLDLRERRLSGIAAELAATLSDGQPCRVCGALEHPAPAVAGAESVSARAENQAAVAAEAAAESAAAVASTVAGMQARLGAATDDVGDLDAAALAVDLAAAAEAVKVAAAAAQAGAAAERALTQARAAVDAARERIATATQGHEVAQHRLTVAQTRLAGLSEHLEQARAGYRDVPARQAALAGRLAAVDAVLIAAQRLEVAQARLRQAEAGAQEAAVRAGFEDLDQAMAALLTDSAQAALERQVIDHNVELESVEEQLTAEEFTALNDGAAAVLDVDGLAVLEHDAQQANLREDEAMKRAALCENAFDELESLQRRLMAHLAPAQPLRERFEAVDDLARCLDGTGGDNTLRMSLSAFVLTARLEQVAAAASVRLAQMSAGRYALAHTDAGERGRGRAGLTLEVIDAWTGVRRQTSTLSGGEAFYTSLALALGLADVVAAEAGGVRLDTLFIDEGFGSLDEDTLEEVMDTLDSLRSGGRVVGIVSHLAELRQRIGTRLEVDKSAQGSTLTMAS